MLVIPWLLEYLRDRFSPLGLGVACVLAISLFVDWQLVRYLVDRERDADRDLHVHTEALKVLTQQQRFLEQLIARLDNENDVQRKVMLYQIRRLENRVFGVQPLATPPDE